MIDYFALFDERRRAWIDLDKLKAKFLALSSELHPDRFHDGNAEEKRVATQRYVELNAAYNCLRDPRERLGHLLELERGAKPAGLQQILPGNMGLFMDIGQLC